MGRPGRSLTAGQPFFVSEFGGIWWNPDVKEGEDSWGYGERPQSLEEFYDRFARLCATLLDDAAHFGYCYTQLTDIYQEQNWHLPLRPLAEIRHGAHPRRATETGGD